MLALKHSLLNRKLGYNIYIYIYIYTYIYLCRESLGFDHFYVKSSYNFCIKDCTEIFYLIYKGNIPSI
jgi:hypothetical protein